MKIHYIYKAFFVGIVFFSTGINMIYAAVISAPEGAVQLSLFPNHEDSSIQISIDLTKLTDNYYDMGVICTKENGNTDFPLKKILSVCGNNIRPPSSTISPTVLERKVYTTSVSNLNPNSTYEFCLTGIKTSSLTTGYFECASITTASSKRPVSLIYINYDVSNTTRDLIKRYEETVKASNPNLTIVKYGPTQKISSEEMLTRLQTQYRSTNLKYVTMIGFDLPVPRIDNSADYSAGPYRNLSRDQSEMAKNFIYKLNEVTIAVIRPESEEDMQKYFNRLYKFYTGAITYDRKFLIADAMIPSEASISLSDKPDRYTANSVDYITGIKTYYNIDSANALNWQNTYGQYLAKSREITIIEAHGGTKLHYPCSSSTDEGCITSQFIKRAQPNSQFIIGISCNIGNFLTIGSPMVAYIFSGNSLAGLGAEVPIFDNNGRMAKTSLKDLAAGRLIGDIARIKGFIVIGDPFLRLDMPQDYKPPLPTPSPSSNPVSVTNFSVANIIQGIINIFTKVF
jgi:hypothetical protein